MNYYGVLPVHVLRNKTLSAFDKIIYMDITSRVGVNGRMPFNMHGLAMSHGVNHGAIKGSLNNLARQKLIFKIGTEISLSAPDSAESTQMEFNLDFVGEVIRKWNEVFKRELPNGVKTTAKLTGIVSDCLVSFSKDDLMSAIDGWHSFCKDDDWWGKDDNKLHRSNMFRFFSNEERITQAMNFKGGGQITARKEQAEDSGLLN